MALPVQRGSRMHTSRTAHRVAPSYRRGLAAVAFVALALTGVAPALAAPADSSVLPPEQHTSD